MQVPRNLQEHSICSMYRDGVSLRTLEVAFDKSDEEIMGVLRRHGVVDPGQHEAWDGLVDRGPRDMNHEAA